MTKRRKEDKRDDRKVRDMRGEGGKKYEEKEKSWKRRL